MSHDFNLIIKNGTVVDGTGGAKRVADIGIQDNKITYIGSINNRSNCNIIDATGCVVAPGFIDIHSHSDFFWLISPKVKAKSMMVSPRRFVVTVAFAFPLKGQLLENKRKGFGKFGLDINWKTAEEFLKRLMK